MLRILVIKLACFLVDLKVYTGVLLRKSYDVWAVFCYFVYTGYHRWCHDRCRVMFRPSLCDQEGRRFEILRAYWKHPETHGNAREDITLALTFSMMFYDWNIKLIKMFLKRVNTYRPLPLDVSIRRDGQTQTYHVVWDFESEKNLTNGTDILFGDITLSDDSVGVVSEKTTTR